MVGEGLLAAVFDLDERVREAIAGLSTAAGGGRSRPCGVLVVLVRAVGGEGVEPSEDDVTLLTAFITGAGVGTFVALLALGVAVRRTRTLAPVPAGLPLAMGIAAIPLLIVGGALESISERLIEVPIAVLGLAWIGLGIGLWNAATHGAAQSGAVADR